MMRCESCDNFAMLKFIEKLFYILWGFKLVMLDYINRNQNLKMVYVVGILQCKMFLNLTSCRVESWD